MDQIDHKARQCAALLIFEEGVTREEAQRLLDKVQEQLKLEHRASVETFNPTYGGVCIYQP